MAFGRKNKVSINPLDYNIMVLGTPKIGKTTLVYEVCEKLVGDDGYLFLEMGNERGADAIEGINYVNVPIWTEKELPRRTKEEELQVMELNNEVALETLIKDITENKVSEYSKLKVVVFDTFDNLIKIAEKECIRQWNEKQREEGKNKFATSRNEAWGFDFYNQCNKLMDEVRGKLARVGVKSIVIGHTKVKEISDPVSGQTYQTLTSDQSQAYFTNLAKSMHFIATGYIDREIAREKSGKKNIVTHQEQMVGKVKNETRKIKFRDDNYAVDDGCRFADIVSEIPFDADEFIKAIKDAIIKEKEKKGVDIKKATVEQEKKNKEVETLIEKKEAENKQAKEDEAKLGQVISFIKENKDDVDKIKPIMLLIKKAGYTNFTDINNSDVIDKLLKAVNKLKEAE